MNVADQASSVYLLNKRHLNVQQYVNVTATYKKLYSVVYTISMIKHARHKWRARHGHLLIGMLLSIFIISSLPTALFTRSPRFETIAFKLHKSSYF